MKYIALNLAFLHDIFQNLYLNCKLIRDYLVKLPIFELLIKGILSIYLLHSQTSNLL